MYKSVFLFFSAFLLCLYSCSSNEEPATKTQVMMDTELFLNIPSMNDNLSDVDYISLQPAIYNDTLRVQVNYIHKDDDSIVMWEKGAVICLYTIYKTNLLGSSTKIDEVLKGKKTLKRADQAFYIDTDMFEMGNYYIIECEIDTGFIKLEPYDTFFYPKRS